MFGVVRDQLLAGFSDYYAIQAEHPRSPDWEKARYAHIMWHPFCAICDAKDKLNVHHCLPYHLYPEFELVEDNLMTLCIGGILNCHLIFGHLGDWKSYNPHIKEKLREYRFMVKERRYTREAV